jgi:hypothetical protein
MKLPGQTNDCPAAIKVCAQNENEKKVFIAASVLKSIKLSSAGCAS